MKLEFSPSSNGGDDTELLALYRIHPWVRDLVGNRLVSVISVMGPDDLPDHGFSECAMGFNVAGRVILRKDGKTVKDISWDEVHTNRTQKDIEPFYLNSPQTEITGTEDVCVVLQDHAHDHDTRFRGISLEIFICPTKLHFKDFAQVRAWLAEPDVRKRLQG